MLVSILADLSVLMGAVLIFFLAREDREYGEDYTRFDLIKFVSLVTSVGVLLMCYSVVIEGARYDYRFLLYALSMKFLGKRITFPSVILITIFRLFWGIDIHMFSSIIYGIVLLLTFSFIHKWISKITNDFFQLVLLAMYTLFIGTLLNLFMYQNFFKDSRIYLVLAVSSILMIFIFVWIRHQISAIYTKAEVDYLTNLLNSRRFYLDLTQLKDASQKNIICMLDIDYFKRINDQFGHLEGDEVLRQVSQVFLQFDKKLFRFYRVGGEEFACLIQDSTLIEAIDLMNTIRKTIGEIHTGLINSDNQEVRITISIGLAVVEQVQEIHQSLRKADDALYYSKIAGRNKVSLFQETGFLEV